MSFDARTMTKPRAQIQLNDFVQLIDGFDLSAD